MSAETTAATDPREVGERERRRDPLRRMIGLARPRSARFALGVLLGAAATGSGVALLGVAAWMLATAANHPSITALSVAVVATRALGVSKGVTRYLERLVTHDAAFRTLAEVRVRVYERLARTEPFGRFRAGDLVSRLVNDTEATLDLLVRGLTPPLVSVVTGGATVLVLTVVYVPGGLLLAAGLLLAGLAVPLAAAALGRGPGRREARARGGLSTTLVDTLQGAPDLVAYGAMERQVARVNEADAELTRVARRDAATLGLSAGANALITGLTVWGALFLGVLAVDDGMIGPTALAVLVLTTLAAFEIVAPLPAVAARLGSIRASGERLLGVLDTPPGVAPPTREGWEIDPAADATVRVRGLRVRYGPEEPWALDGVDLEIPAGATVAVVGPSGAGKSTLASVLLRFMDPDGGRVEIGGVDITDYPADEVRRVVSGVPQDPHVFASTLRENLRLARPEAGDDELWAALRGARLAGEVEAMPKGLDTQVGSHGTGLSGGMRQRLALARAVLAAPRVLVLDEPTAHLDPDTRDAVVADLLDAAEGFSTLLITHDLTGLDRVDRVYVVRDGRVLQSGTHEELLARPGWYRSVWER
ncbi:thiol reductant ABC exporter subunit CydC [Nocardiopsis sp. L17-MgMaSL7]|uniref:thiol reductant ABC exporter subunit CydC n=1 Tax=Nocardiopsis sp. L17-MgMaSL7 TaxID=1938893 RepID=UPI000D70E9AC|nr:thiol reductant ABC exporter subunit CydC [Nocardiopsis sp. L17-MgMaSL7]PWV52872.1 ATP-binding cassette subfamily C protein CydC [Nocardiopsis sp. L17-MgMaSL7]